jgi:hypothetical protein
MTAKKKPPAVVRETAVLPTISASVFKATCLELMDDLSTRHAEMVVTKHGRPIVKIGPVSDDVPSPIGFLRGTVTIHGDIVSPDIAAWEMSDTDPLGGVKW